MSASEAPSLLRVAVNGARGRMGCATVNTIDGAADLELAAACDIDDDLGTVLEEARPDVVVDFTVASAALRNLETILAAGAAAVMGTSGFGAAEVVAAQELTATHGRSALIAPNFALGAVLLARYAAEAAKHMPYVELIEMHHEGKEDAPSGTALKCAADIAAARRGSVGPARIGPARTGPVAETIAGVRGGVVDDVRVHSIRVQGLLARMECILGGPGETLTIRHDTLTRESFMPGVLLAIRRVQSLPGLTYGLEHLL